MDRPFAYPKLITGNLYLGVVNATRCCCSCLLEGWRKPRWEFAIATRFISFSCVLLCKRADHVCVSYVLFDSTTTTTKTLPPPKQPLGLNELFNPDK